MGEVWLARHSLLARPSAVKLIRQDKLEDAEVDRQIEERFQREAQATAQLRSPHTVELYDFGVAEDGDFYYVMEYLAGVDLELLVKRFGPLSPARTVYLLKQASMSLGEAHSAGLVHRDVKPGNLLYVKWVRTLIFSSCSISGSCATPCASDRTSTLEGQITGTPSTVAPEIVEGREADCRVDIYGMGLRRLLATHRTARV